MRKTLLCLSVVLAVCAGCSGLQTKGLMTDTVTENAAKYSAVVQQAKEGTLAVADARAAIPDESGILTMYHNAATGNIFAFWFGGSNLYANAGFMLDLKTNALLFAEAAKRSETCSDDHALAWAARGAQNIVNVDLARRGEKPKETP